LGLRFRESYTTTGSDEDALKFSNPGENYAVVNNGLRSIDKQNIPINGHEIQLSVDNYTVTAYSLSFDMNNTPAHLVIYLNDAYLNTQTQLIDGLVYDFTVDASIAESVAPDRFKLVFEEVTLGNDTFSIESVRLYPNPVNDTLHVEILAATQLKRVEFYNMLGQRVMTSGEKLIDMTNLKSGVYLVKVITAHGELIEKIFKK
jgi:hypothetical protein